MDVLYKTEEAAKLLRLSPRRLKDREWRKKVGLRAIRRGQWVVYTETDLMKFLESSRECHDEDAILESSEGLE